jgi:hypothetical protein
MSRASRAVVSANEDRINDPSKGQEGLDGPGFLAQAVAQFQQTTGKDPADIDAASRGGRLLHMQMDAIVKVIDANQPTSKAPGPTFKGFVPAFFSRLVGEEFSRRANGEAEMRVTAPPDLVRNRKARPDPWEFETITTRFEAANWPKGHDRPNAASVAGRNRCDVAGAAAAAGGRGCARAAGGGSGAAAPTRCCARSCSIC